MIAQKLDMMAAEAGLLAQVWAACRVHGATLVIAKLDRLSRNAHFFGLQKAGVGFVAADMPDANSMTAGIIMAAVAQHERDLIGVRTKAAPAVEGAPRQARRSRRIICGTGR